MASTKPGKPNFPAKSEPKPGQTAARTNPYKPDPVQNPMYDCGYAEAIDARDRSFGVLGFDKRPEASWGGTLLRKQSEEQSERAGGTGNALFTQKGGV